MPYDVQSQGNRSQKEHAGRADSCELSRDRVMSIGQALIELLVDVAPKVGDIILPRHCHKTFPEHYDGFIKLCEMALMTFQDIVMIPDSRSKFGNCHCMPLVRRVKFFKGRHSYPVSIGRLCFSERAALG